MSPTTDQPEKMQKAKEFAAAFAEKHAEIEGEHEPGVMPGLLQLGAAIGLCAELEAEVRRLRLPQTEKTSEQMFAAAQAHRNQQKRVSALLDEMIEKQVAAITEGTA